LALKVALAEAKVLLLLPQQPRMVRRSSCRLATGPTPAMADVGAMATAPEVVATAPEVVATAPEVVASTQA